MFERPSDWQKAIALICDIAKGSSTISIRSYTRLQGPDDCRVEITGWDHHQIQAHGRSDHVVLPLFSLEHLHSVLSGLSVIREKFFSYEVDAALSYEEEAKILVSEIAGIVVTTVKLTVGDANVSWFLVSLNSGRDTLYWKMKYEGRNLRPHLDTAA